jgi:acyl-CoA reductase-like NAD-dependent aldehyde dehydrogenase
MNDVAAKLGLLIGGEVVPGGAGTYPVTNPGSVFVNSHGLSAVDVRAPMGGWKQSGFGVELGPEGMQAFARQRVVVSAGQLHPNDPTDPAS